MCQPRKMWRYAALREPCKHRNQDWISGLWSTCRFSKLLLGPRPSHTPARWMPLVGVYCVICRCLEHRKWLWKWRWYQGRLMRLEEGGGARVWGSDALASAAWKLWIWKEACLQEHVLRPPLFLESSLYFYFYFFHVLINTRIIRSLSTDIFSSGFHTKSVSISRRGSWIQNAFNHFGANKQSLAFIIHQHEGRER